MEPDFVLIFVKMILNSVLIFFKNRWQRCIWYVQGHWNGRSWVRTPAGTGGASKTATGMTHFSIMWQGHPLWPMRLSRVVKYDKTTIKFGK